MATLEEIAHALAVLRASGASDIVLLRCTSSYPAPDDEMHLATISALSVAFQVPVGLSDHSLGVVAPIVAVALGACVIEKHFTLSRAHGGPDAHFSLEPTELAQLVRDVRRVTAMSGTVRFGAGVSEEESVRFRRSLYAVADIAPGTPLSRENVRSVRPGYGLSPRFLDLVIGRRARVLISRGTPLTWDHLLDG